MQIAETSAPQIVPEAHSEESGKSKGKRGGKRAGAGRKPNLVKHLLKGVRKDTIVQAVENIDVQGVIAQNISTKRKEKKRKKRPLHIQST